MNHKLGSGNRGIVLITVLLAAVILLILTSALVALNKQNLLQVSQYRDREIAIELAQAAVAQTVRTLAEEPNFGNIPDQPKDIVSSPSISPNGRFEITFDRTKDAQFYSVNNLIRDVPTNVQTGRYRTDKINSSTADLVVKVFVGSREYRFHVIVMPAIDNTCALSSHDRLTIDGDCVVGSVQGFTPRVHSNFKTSAAMPVKAIQWNQGADKIFEMEKGGIVSCVSGALANSIDEKIRTARDFQGTVDEHASRVFIPDVDVAEMVHENVAPFVNVAAEDYGNMPKNGKYGSPVGTTCDDGAHVQDGSPVFEEDATYYLKGNYVVFGDLNLTNNKIYIDGNLEVIGGVKGKGTVYCSGDTTVTGGATLEGSADGATIISQGNVLLESFDMKKFLGRFFQRYGDDPKYYDGYKQAERIIDKLIAGDKDVDPYAEIINLAGDSGDFKIGVHAPDGSEATIGGESPLAYVLQGLDRTVPGADTPFSEATITMLRQAKSDFKKMALDYRYGRHGENALESESKKRDNSGGEVWDASGGSYDFPDGQDLDNDGTITPEEAAEKGEFHNFATSMEDVSARQRYSIAKGGSGVGGPDARKTFGDTDPDGAGPAGSLQDIVDSYGIDSFKGSIADNNPFLSNPITSMGGFFKGVVYSAKKLNVSNGFGVEGMVLTRGEASLSSGIRGKAKLFYDENYLKGFCRAAGLFKATCWEEL